MLQLFNEFNARKPDEMNVFKGITSNRLFMGIIGVTLVLQVGDVSAVSAKKNFDFSFSIFNLILVYINNWF